MQEGICFENRLSEWKNIESSNCYAFALGLDVDEDEICPYAYRIGNIFLQNKWSLWRSDPDNKIREIEEFILDDFETLGIECKIFRDKDKRQYLQELEHPNDCWDILLFVHRSGCYHFVRVGSNGLLYHKVGWREVPKLTDFEEIQRIYRGYRFARRYRLSLGEVSKK